MKISKISSSPDLLENKNDCKLVQSSRDSRDDSVIYPLSLEKSDESKEMTKNNVESKVNLSASIKTEMDGKNLKDVNLDKTPSPCQDTIHEFEEDDGVTMERVGK